MKYNILHVNAKLIDTSTTIMINSHMSTKIKILIGLGLTGSFIGGCLYTHYHPDIISSIMDTLIGKVDVPDEEIPEIKIEEDV